jgi:VWFA-related protein
MFKNELSATDGMVLNEIKKGENIGAMSFGKHNDYGAQWRRPIAMTVAMVSVFLAAFFLTVLLSAQPSPVIQSGTREVRVDAIVTGKNGAYVRDLNASDFRVWEDNKEQTIQGFQLVSAPAAGKPRSLALFFDETSIEARDQVSVRQAAAAFIDAEAGPNRQIAIVIFDGSVRMVQSFTDNAGRLKDALNEASFHGLAPGADRLSGLARAGGNTAADSFAVRNMIRSLGELGMSLSALPGRKIVVVFAGALQSYSDQKSEVRDAINAANQSGVAFYPVDVRPVFAQTDGSDVPAPQAREPGYPQRGGGPGAGPQGDSDTLGAALADSGPGSQQVAFGLANGTGGFVVHNTTDLLGGLQSIAQEQDQYYELTYAAPASNTQACHALRVKVSRKGTKVRSRAGYCTAKP